MLPKPAWRITKSLPSDADCTVHRVRPAHSHGPEPSRVRLVILYYLTNAKIQGLSFGHTYVKHPLTHAALNTSVQTSMSVCVYRRPTTNTAGFLFGGSWDGPLWGSSSSFESLEPNLELERAAAPARDNEQQSIMRLGSSQLMTDNEA